MGDKEWGNLAIVANGLGCKSWRVMLREIAEGKVVVSRRSRNEYFVEPRTMAQVPITDFRQLSWVEPISAPYAEVPCVPSSPYVTARDDGSFVDTEEFDKPVPQRRPVVEASEPVSVMQVPSVPSNASKADKLDLLAKLGFKAGVKL